LRRLDDERERQVTRLVSSFEENAPGGWHPSLNESLLDAIFVERGGKRLGWRAGVRDAHQLEDRWNCGLESSIASERLAHVEDAHRRDRFQSGAKLGEVPFGGDQRHVVNPVAGQCRCDFFGDRFYGRARLEAGIGFGSGFFEVDVVDDRNVDGLLSFSRGSLRGLYVVHEPILAYHVRQIVAPISQISRQ